MYYNNNQNFNYWKPPVSPYLEFFINQRNLVLEQNNCYKNEIKLKQNNCQKNEIKLERNNCHKNEIKLEQNIPIKKNYLSIYKWTKLRSKYFEINPKRNKNCCEEHKKRHLRCPIDCIGRK